METKKETKFFTIFQYEQEQDYLRKMHASGWKFVKVSGLCVYHFEKCAPEDVVYQLDYNKEGIAHKDEYVKMFSDCGWEYLQDYMGYSYFRKAASDAAGAEEIFCDRESRLQMLGRVFKGRALPLLALLLCAVAPGFFRSLYGGAGPISVFLGAILVVDGLFFVAFARQYSKLKNRK